MEFTRFDWDEGNRRKCREHGPSLKKKIPTFKTDQEAETFVADADLSEFDLSNARMVPFELKPKDRSINLRLPDELLSAVRAEAHRASMPYQRFIRLMLENHCRPSRAEKYPLKRRSVLVPYGGRSNREGRTVDDQR